MKHKSTKNVNNYVIKKVCVLLFFVNAIIAQDTIELKQADSLSSETKDNETITTLAGNIIFQKGEQFLFGNKAVQLNKNKLIKLYENVRVDDGNKTILCDSLIFDTETDEIELFGSVTIKNKNQIITSDKGIIRDKNEKIKLIDNVRIIDQNRKIEGDIIEIIFNKNQIESLKVLKNGVIFSKNFGYEKDSNDKNQLIKNEDLLKAKVIDLKIDNGVINDVELIGMASSFIHLYEDSLYQGTNEISGDQIILKINDNNATELVSTGGVIGQFIPSATNTSGQEKVDYKGDRVEFDTTSRSSKMYGNANIVQIGMDLTAAQININWKSNILEAFDTNIFDENVKLEPNLIEKDREPVSGKSMVYNIKNKKGKVIAGSTKVQNNTYMGKQITTVTDSTFYIEDCIFTSCDPAKFYIGSKQAKIIYGDKIILKPLSIVVGGVPILGIPKAIFPHSNEERRSGWIMPSIGTSKNRGTYMDGLGYYFAPNDYFGSENSIIFADRQGLILKSKNQYKNRYKFNGNFNFEIRKHLSTDEQDIAKLNENNKTDFSLDWNHNQILRKEQTLRSNIKYYSNGEYNRETSIDPVKRLNQQAISNATYSKRWKNKNLSLSMNISNKQDLMSKNKVNSSSLFYQKPNSLSSSITENTITLPSLSFRAGRRSLFKNNPNSFLRNIQWDYNSKLLNKTKNFYRSQNVTTEDGANVYQWEKDENGNLKITSQNDAMIKNKLSINAPFTIMKFIAINPSININSDFVNKYKIRKINELDELELETIDGFKNRTMSKISLSISTKVYGILPIKIFRLQSIRHVVTPRIGFSYSPDYLKNENYFQEFNDEYYDYFSGTLIGSTPRKSSKKINLSLGNVFQAKLKKNETEEKIDLLSFRLSTGYDVNKDDFKLSNLNTSIRSSFNNGTKVDVNLTHDFYKFDNENNIRINEINSSPRLTGIRLSTNFLLKSKNEIEKQNLSENTTEFINDFSSNVWESRLGISYTINKINPSNQIKNFWLNANTSINVTDNWKLNYNARYNLIEKNIVRHNLTLFREIDCWELFIDWTPNGYAKGLYFRLNLKSDMLKDLKIEQKTGIFTTRPSF